MYHTRGLVRNLSGIYRLFPVFSGSFRLEPAIPDDFDLIK